MLILNFLLVIARAVFILFMMTSTFDAQEYLVQNGVLNRAVSEAAGKGVPGLPVEEGVDSQVSNNC